MVVLTLIEPRLPRVDRFNLPVRRVKSWYEGRSIRYFKDFLYRISLITLQANSVLCTDSSENKARARLNDYRRQFEAYLACTKR